MDERLRNELLDSVRTARDYARGETTQLGESVVALANVLAHVLDALGPTKHGQAVQEAIEGPKVGQAPKPGQQGTAGAKQGGTGWPEVERRGHRRIRVDQDVRNIHAARPILEPDPRD